mmetsp:Transcript_13219/g.34652  ORF Transcript_13219/g.34652 Transcript_13219/m.34652 type:complete len:248 (-) Transcript_13219:1064-1807(-)
MRATHDESASMTSSFPSPLSRSAVLRERAAFTLPSAPPRLVAASPAVMWRDLRALRACTFLIRWFISWSRRMSVPCCSSVDVPHARSTSAKSTSCRWTWLLRTERPRPEISACRVARSAGTAIDLSVGSARCERPSGGGSSSRSGCRLSTPMRPVASGSYLDHSARKFWKSAAETGDELVLSMFSISEKFSSITEMKRLRKKKFIVTTTAGKKMDAAIWSFLPQSSISTRHESLVEMRNTVSSAVWK